MRARNELLINTSGDKSNVILLTYIQGCLAVKPNDNQTEICRILVVEDDDIDRLAIKRALKHQRVKYEIEFCYLVCDTQSLIDNCIFDVILTDMSLPDSTGMETIRSLVHLFPKVPVVVLSGTDNDDIALEAVHCGAQDYLPKKYLSDAGLITRTIRHAMERFQLKIGLEKTRERELYFAQYDQCTSLPNRALFFDRLQQTISHAKRVTASFTLLFVDLDRFKQVNDRFGHAAGDKVLERVAIRMKGVLRESDTVARFGGDEFIIILPNTSGNEDVNEICNALIKEINLPVIIEDKQCSVGASVGVAYYPEHGYLSEDLIKNADIAMYHAKQRGRNQVQFFNYELFIKNNDLTETENSLREALDNCTECFKLHFQPKMALENNTLVGVEALIRWHHKDLGIIYPDKFMPLSERIGLRGVIDNWILEEACKTLVNWGDKKDALKLAVNLSSSSLNNVDLITGIIAPMFKKYGVKGQNIEIEINESILIDNDKIYDRLLDLKSFGFSLTLCHFGIGLSNLNKINFSPIDSIKLDKSLICDETDDLKKKNLFKGIVALAQAFDMKVIAVCVETQEQKDFLTQVGCHFGQGSYWARASEQWAPIFGKLSISSH